MSDAIFRTITDADTDAVIALWHAAGITRPWNDPATDLAFARRGSHATVLVGEQAGRIVATVMVGEDGHRGWVYYVAADPALHGTGLGRATMPPPKPGWPPAASGSCSYWCARTTPR